MARGESAALKNRKVSNGIDNHRMNGKSHAAHNSVTPVKGLTSRTDHDRHDRKPHWTTWLWLLPIITYLPWYFARMHYELPEPLPPFDATGRPQVSERNVLAHIQGLEDAGYRVVGTDEAVLGEKYVLDQVRELEQRCSAGGVLTCEVWEQRGDGHHAFNIMDHEVLKMYGGIRNIILRISSKQPPSGKATSNALLLGSHIDSTLPAPGAADDGIGVAVMLDVARVLIDRCEPFDGNIIFLWNGAEETLQDGSHLYSTQHETAKDVKAVINLEAAGTTGGAMLFQATSKEMIQAYSRVPHPRGSVIAADVFSSGIMISDTDFVQFETYLNVSGLDMALVGHSYFYHTRSDSIVNIEKGSSQHFGNNVMAVVDHMLGPKSPLLEDEAWGPPDVVYVTLFDRMWLTWEMAFGDKLYGGISVVALAFTISTVSGIWKAFAIAMVGYPLGVVSGVADANGVAWIMKLVGKELSWFPHEHLCLLLYAPIATAAFLIIQMALARLLSPIQRAHLEQAHYLAQIWWCLGAMIALQAFRIRSAYLFAFIGSILLLGARFLYATNGWGHHITMLVGYVAPLVPLTAFAVEAFTTTLDTFVPLTGRMGRDAPAEHIIATISSACSFIFFPLVAPAFYRLPQRGQRGVVASLLLFTVGIIAFFSGPWWSPYDSQHPKRLGVEYTYNHTSKAHTMHVGLMDRGPTNHIVEDLHARYGAGPIQHTSIGDYDAEWDVLYPFSSFLDTYRFPLPAEEFSWPKLDWTVTESFTAEHRKVHLRVNYTGMVWPAIAFDADIAEWSYDFPPPKGRSRHHIKIAASAEDPIVHLHLTLRDKRPIRMHWSAIDGNQLVPHTAARKGAHMPAGKLLLDMDKWAEQKWKGAVDVVAAGVITGVIEV